MLTIGVDWPDVESLRALQAKEMASALSIVVISWAIAAAPSPQYTLSLR
jgi:hypothetical protein